MSEIYISSGQLWDVIVEIINVLLNTVHQPTDVLSHTNKAYVCLNTGKCITMLSGLNNIKLPDQDVLVEIIWVMFSVL